MVNKRWFQLRTLLLPFLFLTPVVLPGIAITHGFESWCVFSKVVKNSRAKLTRLNLLAITAFCLLVGMIAFVRPMEAGGLPGFNEIFPGMGDNLRTNLANFSISLTFLHIFMDSRLFKLSDPQNHETIGKLFFATE